MQGGHRLPGASAHLMPTSVAVSTKTENATTIDTAFHTKNAVTSSRKSMSRQATFCSESGSQAIQPRQDTMGGAGFVHAQCVIEKIVQRRPEAEAPCYRGLPLNDALSSSDHCLKTLLK